MDKSERRDATLIDGLGNTAFYEALMECLAEVRGPFENRLKREPTTDQLNEHIMSLMSANGACVALGILEAKIEALRDEAVQLQP